MYKRILVPVDGGETANRGLDEAIRLSKALDAKLKIVHIVDDSALVLSPEPSVAAAPLVEEFAEGGKEIINKARAVVSGQGVEAEYVLHENFTGRIADLIAEEAQTWNADLIVMGTHGRTGVRLLGGPAEAVVHATRVPVLLVRGPSKKKAV